IRGFHVTGVQTCVFRSFTALVVSWSLPWLRTDVQIGGDGGHEIFSAPTRSAATGAELLSWAVLRPEGHRGMEITLVALVPILAAMLAALAVLIYPAEATRVTATVAGGLGTLSSLLLWAGWDNSETVPTTGMLTALLGCAMVCASSALWSAGERTANGGPPPRGRDGPPQRPADGRPTARGARS